MLWSHSLVETQTRNAKWQLHLSGFQHLIIEGQDGVAEQISASSAPFKNNIIKKPSWRCTIGTSTSSPDYQQKEVLPAKAPSQYPPTVIVGLREPWSHKEDKSIRDQTHTQKLRVKEWIAAAPPSEVKIRLGNITDW